MTRSTSPSDTPGFVSTPQVFRKPAEFAPGDRVQFTDTLKTARI